MSERTILVTTDRLRYRLIEGVRDDLREWAIEIGMGTLEQILDAYDRRRIREMNARGVPPDPGIQVERCGW